MTISNGWRNRPSALGPRRAEPDAAANLADVSRGDTSGAWHRPATERPRPPRTRPVPGTGRRPSVRDAGGPSGERGQPYLARFPAKEAEQTTALGHHGCGAPLREAARVPDEERVVVDAPDGADHAVDEQRSLRLPPCVGEQGPDFVGRREASAVGVREQDVVVLRQEPRGAGMAGSGRGASGTSKTSRARASRNATRRGRRCSTTARRPVRRDHVAMSATLAGPNAAR